MDDSVLKEALQQCTDGPFQRTDFSIGHRGAALQFPEHTKESYEAAARMGAGIKCCTSDITQEAYAQQMIDEYKAAGVNPKNVYAQSFNLDDVLYWINHEPRFGNQAVYLDGRYDLADFDYTDPATWNPSMEELVAQGVNIIAPPIYMLLKIDGSGNIAPSTYAEAAKAAGLDITTWTLERSGLLKDGGGWYYQSVTENIDNDGDMYEVLDVLAKDVGILGIFSDWPATVTFYSNCMGLK
ncbi:hypothetical protein DSCO28_24150 [Desulfosarcina ovata subsp. sediminis]|uniref:glycerophosphodiester phosphodiesterase n=1 Tax=Desulfosarcina ovata subsp. sediminis TaxID=885957 RepID=A0A5K7ZPQ8_9BACT|nr:hypothetical protein [Desulfosarcina ovata]BBO81849.1 hypothetical protein DSCO28_24150 [Desulfosarcina ovata subsp. sediminis]